MPVCFSFCTPVIADKDKTKGRKAAGPALPFEFKSRRIKPDSYP